MDVPKTHKPQQQQLSMTRTKSPWQYLSPTEAVTDRGLNEWDRAKGTLKSDLKYCTVLNGG